MQSTRTGIESNLGHQRGQLAFIIFLLLSPILPYVITMTYNNFLFARTEAEIPLLPSYPGAQLVDSEVVNDYRNSCPEWRLHYVTRAAPENVGIFYEAVLLRMGWHRSDELEMPERYAKSTMDIRVEYRNEGQIRLTVTSDAFPFFDPRCL
jgi:hypothetical protein